ncbi:MAG TPA: hypothetical protein VM580_02020 [Labilithrix sp.]|nr:hypothetical protein [Labilithrix sp.]
MKRATRGDGGQGDGQPVDDLDQLSSDRLLTMMAAGTILFIHAGFLIAQLLHVGTHIVDVRIRLAIVVLVTAVTVLLWTKKSPSRAWCAGAFAGVILPFTVTFWATETTYAAQGRTGMFWEPFIGLKLVFFIIAALCPSHPRWLAPILFVIFIVEALALWFVLDLGDANAHITLREPHVTTVYALVAWTLLMYRRRHARHDRDLTVARAEAAMLRTTNDAFVAVQDMANTPLQNLEIALTLMAKRQPSDPLVSAACRAAVRLRELGQLLPVKQITRASVDPLALERIRNLNEVADDREAVRAGSGGTLKTGEPLKKS